MLSPPWFPLEGPFQERGPGLLEFPTAGPAPDSPDSQCIGGGKEGRLVRLGRPEDPRKRKRLTLRVSGTGRRTCPGQGPRGTSALTVSAVQHKGETHHITLDLPVHLDAPRTSARTPRLCRGYVPCNCIKYLDRSVSILKLGFLTNDLKLCQKQAWFYKQLLIKPNRITGIRTIKLNRNFMKT